MNRILLSIGLIIALGAQALAGHTWRSGNTLYYDANDGGHYTGQISGNYVYWSGYDGKGNYSSWTDYIQD